jgi:hypothetical protein
VSAGATLARAAGSFNFFMELPMVRKNYAHDENAPRQPYADKDAGVGMGRITLDDDDDIEEDLDDEEEDDAQGTR